MPFALSVIALIIIFSVFITRRHALISLLLRHIIYFSRYDMPRRRHACHAIIDIRIDYADMMPMLLPLDIDLLMMLHAADTPHFHTPRLPD